MFIKCEKCDAVFELDDSLVPENKKFRCGICGHTFTCPSDNQPEENTVIPPVEIQPQPVLEPDLTVDTQPADIPAVSVPEEFQPVPPVKHTNNFFWVLFYLIILSGLIAAFVLFLPQIKNFVQPYTVQKQLPVQSLPDLEITNTSFRIVPDAGNDRRLLIQGALYNPADRAQNTRVFWIELYDAANTLIDSHPVTPLQPRILPHATLPFYTEITPVPDALKHVNIRFK